MQDIEKCLKDDETISKASKDIANDIVEKKVEIVELIEALGPSLTSTDVELRVKATQLLSQVLAELPADFLSTVQLNFISTFYCDRLKDHHSVVPNTLSGIQALLRMNNLPDDCIARLLQSIFQHVPCQSQVRADREKIFGIIKTLSETKTTELLAMGTDFVYGFIGAMDGERDPRLLVFLFDYIPVFLKTFPLGHLTDDMFEVIACYFPIDFNPSPNDAATITRDLLADKLSECLCGHDAFVDECVNLLVEKLDSQLSVAKLDSLFLLSKASVKFPPKSIEQYFPSIWKALRAELLPGSSKEITMAALDALQMLIAGIGKDDGVCENVLTEIMTTLLPSLSDVDSRLFSPSAAVALKCTIPTKLSSALVTQKCLPAFLLQINKDSVDRQVQRGTLIEISAQMLATCIQNEVIDKIDSKLLETAQFEFVNCLVSKSAANEKLINIALSALAVCADIVNESNRPLVYCALNAYLKETSATESVAIDVTGVLSAFGEKYPDEVSTEIVQALLSTDYIRNTKLTPHAIAQLFEVLCCLIPIRKFRRDILAFLFKNIFDESDDTVHTQEIRLIAIRVLHHILDDDKNEQLHEEVFTENNIFDRFVSLIRSKHLSTVNAEALTANDDILFEMSQIMRIIVTDLDGDAQKTLIEKYLPTMNLQRKTDLYFVMGLLGYLDPTVSLENHFDALVHELSQLALHSTDDDVTKIANQLLSSLFNKCPDDHHHRGILKKIIELIALELKKHNKKAVEVLSWISKGLLARGHDHAAHLIDTLIKLLEHPTLSEAAIAAFEVISVEFPELHLPVIKHFFQQKLFQLCLKSLWSFLESFSVNHLNAFVFVLRMTPHQVLANNIQKIGPILLQSLTLQKPKAVLVALDICKRFVVENDEYFRDHLQNLVPQCIKLSTNPDSMNVRIGAINILSSITAYPAFIILPFAPDVLHGLLPALDDKKRLVRSAAVLTRNQWFQIGSEN